VGRFPPRTLILMVLTLLAFAWFWWRTHHPGARQVTPVSVIHLPAAPADGGDH
jgi:hypothetical protein